MKIKRTYSAFSVVIAITALIFSFQNCAKNADLSQYTNASTSVPVVVEPPAVVGQSPNLTIAPSQPAMFNVSATGTALEYRWLKNGNIVAGAVEPVLNIPSAQAADAGTYTVFVKNSIGEVSVSYTLAVQTPPPPPAGTKPAFVTLPADVYIQRTQSFSVQVVASGPSLSYQWSFQRLGTTGFVPIAGATFSVYSVANAAPLRTGTYMVTVTNPFGFINASAFVEVDPEAPGRIDTR